MKTILGHDFPQRNKAYMSNGDTFLFMLMKISILLSGIKCVEKAHLEKIIEHKSNKWEELYIYYIYVIYIIDTNFFRRLVILYIISLGNTGPLQKI